MVNKTATSIKSYGLGIGWLLITLALFTLPGNNLPQNKWQADIHLDKWVHIFLFIVLVYLFYVPIKNTENIKSKALISFLALLYGVIIEFVQKYFIPNRSFDGFDIVADGVGSFLPLLWQFIKPRIK